VAAIELLCGMIASGKSTYAAYRARQGALVVDHDTIVLGLHGGLYELYNDELKPIYKSLELAMFTSAILSGRSVLVDRVFHRRATRARFIEIAAAYDVPVICTLFPRESPEVHALRRFKGNNRGLSLSTWRAVALNHNATWQEPELREGFKHIQPVPEII
jgi:predicted kinase